MISFNMAEFDLFKIVKNEDKYSTPTTAREFVKRVPVSISFIAENKRLSELEYKNCSFSGITPFKEFEKTFEYELESVPIKIKLQNDIETKSFYKEVYKIKSVNSYARLTQLLLEMVVHYE